MNSSELKSQLSQVTLSATKAYEQALQLGNQFESLGSTLNFSDDRDFMVEVYQGHLDTLCQKLTLKHQGMSTQSLASNDYYHYYCHGDMSLIRTIDEIDFEGISERLAKDCEQLEQNGFEVAAASLVNHVLGYSKDACFRKKSAYECHVSLSTYGHDSARIFEEIKNHLGVVLKVIQEDVSLECFDEYDKLMRPAVYSHSLPSRSVYGSKTDRICITHFKEKAVISFAPMLFESIIAFLSCMSPELLGDFELPSAA